MNKYIKFLLVPIMLFGITGNSCYSMYDIYNYENYNEVDNNQLVPKNKQLDKLTTNEKRIKKIEQAIKDNARRMENRHNKTLGK